MHYVLRRFRERDADYEDLFQYGCIGLMKAIDRFDAQYEVRFSTYAVPVIMGEIRKFLRDDGPVHVSRTIHENSVRVQRFRERFEAENAREPTISEISQGEGLSNENVLLALNAGARVRSLSESVGGDGDLRLMDVIGVDNTASVDTRLMLAELLRGLAPQERMLIVRRYFSAHTQSQIARDMGISQVQVSRLESRILKRMRGLCGDG